MTNDTRSLVDSTDAETVEMLCGRVTDLEQALKGLIDECLFEGDSRKPRPALVHARDILPCVVHVRAESVR